MLSCSQHMNNMK